MCESQTHNAGSSEMFERPNVTVVVNYGNDMDGVTTHPEVVGQNVDLKEFTDEYQRKHSRCSSLVITIINRDKPSPWMVVEYQRKHSRCSSLVITIINRDKPSPWMVGSKAGPGRSMEVRYGNTK